MSFIKFLRSFMYAFRGIKYAVKNERNMRLHICAGITVTGLSGFYELTAAEYCITALCIGAVISSELINTGIERAVDIAAKGGTSPLAEAAKDCGAAGVLVSGIAAAVCGAIIFFRAETLRKIADYYMSTPAAAAGLALWIVFCIFFAFGKKNEEKP